MGAGGVETALELLVRIGNVCCLELWVAFCQALTNNKINDIMIYSLPICDRAVAAKANRSKRHSRLTTRSPVLSLRAVSDVDEKAGDAVSRMRKMMDVGISLECVTCAERRAKFWRDTTPRMWWQVVPTKASIGARHDRFQQRLCHIQQGDGFRDAIWMSGLKQIGHACQTLFRFGWPNVLAP